MDRLDPDDARPPYAQVADALRTDIARGHLSPGQKLASHQALADQYGVSVGTVKRALGELQGAGLVISRQGQGAFVRTQLPSTPDAGHDDMDTMKRALAALDARVSSIEHRLDAE